MHWPDVRVPLHPPVQSKGAASLLPCVRPRHGRWTEAPRRSAATGGGSVHDDDPATAASSDASRDPGGTGHWRAAPVPVVWIDRLADERRGLQRVRVLRRGVDVPSPFARGQGWRPHATSTVDVRVWVTVASLCALGLPVVRVFPIVVVWELEVIALPSCGNCPRPNSPTAPPRPAPRRSRTERDPQSRTSRLAPKATLGSTDGRRAIVGPGRPGQGRRPGTGHGRHVGRRG